MSIIRSIIRSSDDNIMEGYISGSSTGSMYVADYDDPLRIRYPGDADYSGDSSSSDDDDSDDDEDHNTDTNTNDDEYFESIPPIWLDDGEEGDFPDWRRRKLEIIQRDGDLRNLRKGVKQYIRALSHYSWEYDFIRPVIRDFRDDPEVLLSANAITIGRDFDPILFDVSTRLRDDIDFVSKMVLHRGRNLKYASPRLKDDKEFAIKMVKEFGFNLKYVSPRLRGDPDTVLCALTGCYEGGPFKYATDDLKDNIEFMIQAIEIDPCCLEYASEAARDDRNLVSLAVQKMGYALRFASPRLQNNKKIVMAAVQEDGFGDAYFGDCYKRVLKYASFPLQHDIDVVATAELRKIKTPRRRNRELINRDLLLNRERTPISIFPYILKQANHNPLVIYYTLKNRPDLIPRFDDNAPTNTNQQGSNRLSKKRRLYAGNIDSLQRMFMTEGGSSFSAGSVAFQQTATNNRSARKKPASRKSNS